MTSKCKICGKLEKDHPFISGQNCDEFQPEDDVDNFFRRAVKNVKNLRKMKMNKKQGFKCCLCKEWKLGWGENKQYGNNPAPLMEKGECCSECDNTKVIPKRIEMNKMENKTTTAEQRHAMLDDHDYEQDRINKIGVFADEELEDE